LKVFHVYLLSCADGSYYVGHTDSLEMRVGQHQSGVCEGYTRSRRPVMLLKAEGFGTRVEALCAEMQLKGWSRAKKDAWVKGDFALLKVLAKKDFSKKSG
jgi:predicted GIY-YIG superfamily endonuclease